MSFPFRPLKMIANIMPRISASAVLLGLLTGQVQAQPEIEILLGTTGIQSKVLADTNTSQMIDLGNPGWAFAEEPNPNGAVRNMGAFGNTMFASQSSSNAYVFALTASSGGRLEGFLDLIWAYGNLDPTNTVSLDYSFDNGVTWTGISSGVSIANRSEPWDTTVYPSSPVARWRITVDNQTNITDITDNFFALRNDPFIYYLNDSSLSNDVFTTMPGDDSNLGFFSNAPKATLENLLFEIDVEGGDTILFDTGTFVSTNPVVMSGGDAGMLGVPVIVRGSTNGPGSTLTGTAALLTLAAPHVTVSNLTFNGNVSVSAQKVSLDHIVIKNGGTLSIAATGTVFKNSLMLGGSMSMNGVGNIASQVEFSNSTVSVSGMGHTMANTLIYGDSGGTAVTLSDALSILMTNNTLVGQRTQLKLVQSSSVFLENNIIIADGPDTFVILKEDGSVNSDYNNLVARNGAWIGSFDGFWEHLVYWQRESGQDLNSLSHEPLFVDEAAGNYHLQSVKGTLSNGMEVVSANHSPAIDAGNPLSSFGEEPLPHGNRVNLGAYGNTPFAAKSREVGDKSVVAITGNDGGVLRGTNVILRWNSSNLTGGDTVTLQYSPDGGSTWTNIVAGLASSLNSYTWDTTPFAQSLNAFIRVVLDSDTNIFDAIDQSISLRHSPLDFYVNDSSTLGDVFSTVVGNAGNDGLSSNAPKLTLSGILTTYDVEGGDTIWLDTGDYTSSGNTEWIWSNGGGELGTNVILQGVGKASRINVTGISSNQAALLIHGDAVTLREIGVSSTGAGVHWATNVGARVERSWFMTNAIGVKVTGSDDGSIMNSIFQNNSAEGVFVDGSSSIRVDNNTFVYTNAVGFRSQSSSQGSAKNNIFQWSGGTNSYGVRGDLFSVDVDYNVYDFPPGQEFAPGFDNLRDWQISLGNDFRSALTNASFFDVANSDYHLLSTEGRYDPGVSAFVTVDVVNAWAIDKGDPNEDFDLEPEENGDRMNVGAFAGTKFASKGFAPTQEIIEVRSLNEPFEISETNSIQPLIWHALNVPTNLFVDVDYSGDGGITWITISNLNVYTEFVVWQPTPINNSFKALWRVIGETNGVTYADTNAVLGELFFGEFEILSISNSPIGLQKIHWNGAWDEEYQVEYSEDGFTWTNAPFGVGPDQDDRFIAPIGGDLFYEDVESNIETERLYRVIFRP